MQNHLKKLGGKLISSGLMMSIFAYGLILSAYGADPVSPFIDGQLSVTKCVQQGTIGFVSFLEAASFSDGILNGIIEPFNDVLFRNQCQGNDILGLIKQRDQVRKQIRDSFLTCNDQKVPVLVRAFEEVNMEIYYVRHVVDGKVVISLPFDLLSTRMAEDEESLYYPREKLYNEMKERYVEDGNMPANEFDLFFRKLETKYKDRKKNYVICEQTSWQQVADKWEEFISNVGGIAPAWKDFSRGVSGSASKLAETATNTSFKNWISGLVGVSLNNQELRPGLLEIIDNLGKYAPSTSVANDSVTQEQLLEALKAEGQTYDIEAIKLEISNTFATQYKGASDVTIIVFSEELDALNKAILAGLEPMDQIRSCSKTINSRQCP
ncbi:hypothetical protein HY604_01365 [Candidatus Peregrinibacteria bacterium]|nr:hypothetical protein [Candidatus Peregrinibacteria bacterium]